MQFGGMRGSECSELTKISFANRRKFLYRQNQSAKLFELRLIVCADMESIIAKLCLKLGSKSSRVVHIRDHLSGNNVAAFLFAGCIAQWCDGMMVSLFTLNYEALASMTRSHVWWIQATWIRMLAAYRNSRRFRSWVSDRFMTDLYWYRQSQQSSWRNFRSLCAIAVDHIHQACSAIIFPGQLSSCQEIDLAQRHSFQLPFYHTRSHQDLDEIKYTELMTSSVRKGLNFYSRFIILLSCAGLHSLSHFGLLGIHLICFSAF